VSRSGDYDDYGTHHPLAKSAERGGFAPDPCGRDLGGVEKGKPKPAETEGGLEMKTKAVPAAPSDAVRALWFFSAIPRKMAVRRKQVVMPSKEIMSRVRRP
jgi:hypothetical protein